MEFHYIKPIRILVGIPCSIFSNLVERFTQNRNNFMLFSIVPRLFSVVFTCCFAFVGIFLGFIAGAAKGQETESGFVRGGAIGAISGAVFSLEVFESFVRLWRSNESTIGCLLYLIDVISSFLSGRLVREQIGPALLSAVQSQMSEIESGYEELASIFDIGGVRGLSVDLLEKIPIVKITKEQTLDSSGEKLCCSVLLLQPLLKFRISAINTQLIQEPKCVHYAGLSVWRIRSMFASLSPHVPSSVHRQMARETWFLPSLQTRSIMPALYRIGNKNLHTSLILTLLFCLVDYQHKVLEFSFFRTLPV
ncbi:hypothetical protein V2J09_002288 [Rumex salicifolius]